jgi:hypothetical protein
VARCCLGRRPSGPDSAQRLIECSVSGVGEAQHAAALYLLRVLFPRLNGLYGNTSYGPKWDAGGMPNSV